MKPTMQLEYRNGLLSPERDAWPQGNGRYKASFPVPMSGLVAKSVVFRHPELSDYPRTTRVSEKLRNMELYQGDTVEMDYKLTLRWDDE